MAKFKLDRSYGQNTAEILWALRMHSGQLQKDTAEHCLERFDPPATPEKIRSMVRMIKSLEHSDRRPDVVELGMLINAYGADILGYLVALYTGDYRIAILMADSQIGTEIVRQLAKLYDDHADDFDRIQVHMIKHIFENLSKRLSEMLQRDDGHADIYRVRPSRIRPSIEKAIEARRAAKPRQLPTTNFRKLLDELVNAKSI